MKLEGSAKVEHRGCVTAPESASWHLAELSRQLEKPNLSNADLEWVP